MRFDDAAGDVEPEPGTSAVVFAGLPEPLENQLEHSRGYTDASVFHREVQPVFVACTSNGDRRLRRGELDRVGEQVREYLER